MIETNSKVYALALDLDLLERLAAQDARPGSLPVMLITYKGKETEMLVEELARLLGLTE